MYRLRKKVEVEFIKQLRKIKNHLSEMQDQLAKKVILEEVEEMAKSHLVPPSYYILENIKVLIQEQSDLAKIKLRTQAITLAEYETREEILTQLELIHDTLVENFTSQAKSHNMQNQAVGHVIQ